MRNDWQIVTEVPQSYIISRSRILVSLILVTLLMTVFFTVSMVIFLSRNLSQKVRQLSGTISRLSTTTPDQLVQDLTPFTHRDPRAMDEIDQLAIVFQTMFRQQHENASKLLAISVQKERLNTSCCKPRSIRISCIIFSSRSGSAMPQGIYRKPSGCSSTLASSTV